MLAPEGLTSVIEDLKLEETWGKRFKPNHKPFSRTEALDHIAEVVSVEPKKDTDIFEITAQSEEAREAADIANAIADHYKARSDREEEERYKAGISAYEKYIVDQQKNVEIQKGLLEKQCRDNKIKPESLTASSINSPLLPVSVRMALYVYNQQSEAQKAYANHLEGLKTDQSHMESSVRIVTRATVP